MSFIRGGKHQLNKFVGQSLRPEHRRLTTKDAATIRKERAARLAATQGGGGSAEKTVKVLRPGGGGRKAASDNVPQGLSSTEKGLLVGATVLFGVCSYISYEVKENPLGSIATTYRGSILESVTKSLFDTFVAPLQDISQPFNEKLVPDYESGPFYGEVPPGSPPPPLLVLDLEQTLIGSVHDAKYGWRHVKRPGLKKFIDRMSQYYEIVIYSENDRNPDILMAIDPENRCHKLGSESAEARHGVMLKRLDLMNRDLSRVILIDDSAETSQLFPRNTLLIEPFENIYNKNDNALLELMPLLQAMIHDGVTDFRDTFDDLGTHTVSEAVTEYKMRLSNNKRQIMDKREKGLGGLIKRKQKTAFVSNDDEFEDTASSMLSRIVNKSTSPGFIEMDPSAVQLSATELDLSGVGAGKHTGVGSASEKTKKKFKDKKKGALFQWLDDSTQESEKHHELKMQKMNELYAKRMQEKEKKAEMGRNA